MKKGFTKKELAAAAGYTYRRLYDIDRSLPKEKKLFVECEDGKFDLAIFVQRWVDFNVNQNTPVIKDLDAIRAEHEAIKAQKTQLQVDHMRGQLVDVQDVKALWSEIANNVKLNLLNLPKKVSPMLVMRDNVETIAAIMDEEIRAVLEEMAEVPLPEEGLDEESDEEE